MIIDGNMTFANQQSLSGNSDQLSTNIYDAGSAKKLFGGGGKPVKVSVQVTAIGGTTPNFRARLVAASATNLTSNVVILADSGVSRTLAAGDLPYVLELTPADQLDSLRYYGVIFTQGGNSDNTATANANLVMDAQSNFTGIGP